MMLKYFLVAIVAYLFGNFTTSFFVSKRVANIDIRKHGSGNAGATNVLRVLGVKPAIFTFIGDGLKGIFAVLLGGYIAGTYGTVVAGAFVVIGHNWPVVLKFKGGKGIAATVGVMLMIKPLLVLIVVAVGIIVIAFTKYVSLGSVIGVTLFALLMIILRQPVPYVELSVILAVLALYQHRLNIVRLIKGTEAKLGKKANIE